MIINLVPQEGHLGAANCAPNPIKPTTNPNAANPLSLLISSPPFFVISRYVDIYISIIYRYGGICR